MMKKGLQQVWSVVDSNYLLQHRGVLRHSELTDLEKYFTYLRRQVKLH